MLAALGLCGIFKVGLLFQEKTHRLLISKPGGLGPMSAGTQSSGGVIVVLGWPGPLALSGLSPGP